MTRNTPLFAKIDCLQIPVPDLDEGLAFYRDQLGHPVVWRSPTQVGLRIGEGDTEIVLQTERPMVEVDLTVLDVQEAITSLVKAGGSVVVEPFEIPVGWLAVVADPFGNRLVILDNSNGTYDVDDEGRVRGVRSVK